MKQFVCNGGHMVHGGLHGTHGLHPPLMQQTFLLNATIIWGGLHGTQGCSGTGQALARGMQGTG